MAQYTEITGTTDRGREATIDVTFDIDVDADLTGAADLQDYRLKALIMPAAWTAADITLQCSVDDSTFNPVYNESGTEYTLTVSTSRYVRLQMSDTYNLARYIKLKSSTDQLSADRTITLVLEK